MKTHYIVILLFLLSVSIRLAVGIPTILADSTPVYDEEDYYRQASATKNMIQALLTNEPINPAHVRQFYMAGARVPGHALILSSGMLVFREGYGVARMVGIFVSALTTPLLFLVTLEMFRSKTAGIVAGVIHTFFPTFIYHSHQLFTETNYVFFVVLAVYLLLVMLKVESSRSKVALAAATGFAAGYSALIRPNGIVSIPVLVLGSFLLTKKRWLKWILPLVISLLWLLTLVPWETTLYLNEERLVPLSTLGGVNLFDGARPPGMSIEEWDRMALERGGTSNILEQREVKGELGREEVINHPVRYVSRSAQRAIREIWAFDFTLSRHFHRVVYPPLPFIVTDSILLVTVILYLVVVFFGVWGYLVAPPVMNRAAYLLPALIVTHLSITTLFHAVPRYNVVLMALLLPPASYALSTLRSGSLRLSYARVAASLILPISMLTVLPDLDDYPSSSYYLGSLFTSNTPSIIYDKITIEAPASAVGSTLVLETVGDDYFINEEDSTSATWEITSDNINETFLIFSYGADAPAVLEATLSGSAGSVEFVPVSRETYKTSTPLGVGDLRYMWISESKCCEVYRPAKPYEH